MGARCKTPGNNVDDPYVVCAQCGFKNLYSQTGLIWNNTRVCIPECYEEPPRILNPAPIFKGEFEPLPNINPEPPDNYKVVVTSTTTVNLFGATIQVPNYGNK